MKTELCIYFFTSIYTFFPSVSAQLIQTLIGIVVVVAFVMGSCALAHILSKRRGVSMCEGILMVVRRFLRSLDQDCTWLEDYDPADVQTNRTDAENPPEEEMEMVPKSSKFTLHYFLSTRAGRALIKSNKALNLLSSYMDRS